MFAGSEVEEGEVRDGEYLILTLEPHSELAARAIQELSDLLWSDRSSKQARGFEKALGALVGGLVRNESRGRHGWSYRKTSSGSFTGEPVGYRGFREAFDRLVAIGGLEKRKGTGGGNEIGVATRFRPTALLLGFLTDVGISVDGWREHFRSLPRPTSIKHPIILKRSSVTRYGKKRPGVAIRVDLERSPARELGAQVNELNTFFAGIDIQPDDEHHAFHRLFNQADIPGFDWNKGGRLYSVAGGYQCLSSADRKQITLNGQRVVEIDIRASHLTILHAKLGLPFDPAGDDPYAIDDIDRAVVKAWVTMTLGYDRFQTRWSDKNKAWFYAETGRQLQKVHPITKTKDRILKRLPALSDWPKCRIRWGDLQYLESCAIIDAVYRLAMEHGIPALPVHDSIIVPIGDQCIAKKTLIERFEACVGVRPALSAK